MRVLVFGDSITYGAWDIQGGWADRLKQQLHRQYVETDGSTKIQLINLGIGSDSSTKILKRIPNEIEARYSKSWPFVFVFSFCTNDARSLNGVIENSLAQYTENIKKIINLAREHTDKILFCGVPPISQPLLRFKDHEYSDQRTKEYETTLRGILKSEEIAFVEIRSHFAERQDQGLFSVDGLHPNDVGHALIAGLVLPELEKLLV